MSDRPKGSGSPRLQGIQQNGPGFGSRVSVGESTRHHGASLRDWIEIERIPHHGQVRDLGAARRVLDHIL